MFFFFFLLCKIYLTEKLKAHYKNTNMCCQEVSRKSRFKCLSHFEFLEALEGLFWCGALLVCFDVGGLFGVGDLLFGLWAVLCLEVVLCCFGEFGK